MVQNVLQTPKSCRNSGVKCTVICIKCLHYSPIIPGGGPIMPGGGPPTGMRGGPGCCGRI